MGQGIGGGARVVVLEQHGGGGEQVGGALDMARRVLGMSAQVEDAAAYVVLACAGQGRIEQLLGASGVSGQPRRIGRRQPPPRRILGANGQRSRLLRGPGSGGEPGPP